MPSITVRDVPQDTCDELAARVARRPSGPYDRRMTPVVGRRMVTLIAVLAVVGLLAPSSPASSRALERSAGRSAASSVSSSPTAVSSAVVRSGAPAVVGEFGSRFFAVDPTRVLDSRTALGGFAGPIGAGQTKDLPVAGVVPVGADAVAVVMNVTVTQGSAASYLTVAPAGASPTAASLVFAAGQTTSNQVTVALGPGGSVGFFNQAGSVHVVADVVGWYGPSRAGGLFRSVAPTRIADSREGSGPWGDVPFGAGEVRALAVGGVGPVPVTAEAAVMNVTVTGGTTGSYLAASASGSGLGSTADLLFGPGETRSGLVTVGLSDAGSLLFFNQRGSVDVVVDLLGYFDHTPGGAGFFPVTPTRMVDDRIGLGATGPWGPAANRTVPFVGVSPLSADASGIVANVTVTNGTAGSYVALRPSPGAVPAGTANVLFAPGQTVANAVVTGLGAGGGIDVFNQRGSVDVVVDVAGWFGPPDDRRTRYDRDGDGRADLIAYELGRVGPDNRPSWYEGSPANPIGAISAWLPVPGDYDGDGRWELAEVTAAGDWVTEGRRSPVHFPRPVPQVPPQYVVPVPADYDGDGHTDPAWYDEGTGTWYVYGQTPVVFGEGPSQPGSSTVFREDQDVAVPGDYDGDGRADLATYRPGTARWQILRSSDGAVDTFTLGDPVLPEWPVAVDFDGVGHDQPAVYDWVSGYKVRGRSEAVPAVGPSPGDAWWPAAADYLGEGGSQASVFDAGVYPRLGPPPGWVYPTGPSSTAVASLGYPYFPWMFPVSVEIDVVRLTLLQRCLADPTSGWC